MHAKGVILSYAIGFVRRCTFVVLQKLNWQYVKGIMIISRIKLENDLHSMGNIIRLYIYIAYHMCIYR